MKMTEELIGGMIKFSVAIIAPIAAATIWLCKKEDNNKEKLKITKDAEIAIAKENSAGATAILDLIKKDKEIQEEIEEIETRFAKKDDDRSSEIRALGQNIQNFTLQAIALLGGNINKH